MLNIKKTARNFINKATQNVNKMSCKFAKSAFP